MSSGFYSFIEGQLRTWILDLGRAIDSHYTLNIIARPDKRDTHAAILLASKLSHKTHKLNLFLYHKPLTIKFRNDYNILIGYEEKTGLMKKGLFINNKNSIYTTTYTSLLIAEEMSIVRNDEKIVAVSSVYQNSECVSSNNPILNDTHVSGNIRIYRKFPAITGGASRPLSHALYQTLFPYYPSLTGKPLDEIEGTLEKMGLNPSKTFAEQNKKGMEKLVDFLLKDIRKYDSDANTERISSTIMIGKIDGKDIDLREIGEAIDLALDNDPSELLNLYGNRIGLKLMLSNRINKIAVITNIYSSIMNKEYDAKPPIIILKCNEKTPISTISNLLRKNKLLQENYIMACETRKGVYTSIYEAYRNPDIIERGIIDKNKVWID